MKSVPTFATVRAARRAQVRPDRFAIQPPSTGRAVAGSVGTHTGTIKRASWQEEAYRHAEDIGEVGYVLNLMASTVAKG